MSNDESFVYTACPGWGDHDYCVVKSIVKDGKIIRAEKVDYPDKKLGCSHICQKGLEAIKQPYSDKRLLHPLKRVGERGSGEFEEISWEQALDEIAEKMLTLAKQYGPETVACWNMPAGPPPNNGLGTMLSSRLFGLWGATDPMQRYGLDNGPQYAGMYTFGNPLGYLMMDLRIIENADLVVVWGGNPVENQHRVAASIAAAKDNGARIIDIGLLFDGTAGFADQFIGAKPGSDCFLSLSMARYIIDNHLEKRDFLIAHTNAPLLVNAQTGQLLHGEDGASYLAWDADAGVAVAVAPGQGNIPCANPALEGVYEVAGVSCKPAFQLLAESLEPYTLEACEKMTGVTAQVVADFCKEYCATESSYILAPLGFRYKNQGEFYRSMYLLGALAGTLGGESSGVHTNVIASSAPIMFNNGALTRPLGREGDKMVHISQGDFFEQAQSEQPYPIKAFWKGTGNPVHNCPNRGRWIETFNKMELVVDVDIWLTDTGMLADYVLPDCMPHERMEIIDAANYGHVILQEPAIEPQGEAREPNYLYSELARRLGLGEYFDKTTEEWLALKLETDYPPIAQIEPKLTFERLKKEKIVPIAWPDPNYWDPLRGLNVFTATGRVDIYAERLAQFGAAVPRFDYSIEVPMEGAENKEYPYHFFSGRQRFFMQSMFTNDPLMIELSGKEPSARMNPVDAAREGIIDGDLVEVYNQRGHVVAPMRLDEAIPPGSVQVWFGWRKGQFKEGTYAELLVPLGANSTHDDIADFWFDETVQMFGIDDMVNSYATAYAGGWDTIWDCACNVRKYVETKEA